MMNLVEKEINYTLEYKLMKVVLQRVKSAKVVKNNTEIESIQSGYVLLCGYKKNEEKDTIIKLVAKILKAKLFEKWKKT